MCVSPMWQASKCIIFYKIFYLFFLFEENPCICACVCVYMCVKSFIFLYFYKISKIVRLADLAYGVLTKILQKWHFSTIMKKIIL